MTRVSRAVREKHTVTKTDRLLSTKDAAIMLGMSGVDALKSARWRGDPLPPCIRLGTGPRPKIVYKLSDVERFISSMAAHDTTDFNKHPHAPRSKVPPSPSCRGFLK
jgi:hypothetical protein